MLKFTIDNLDGIDTTLQSLYEKTDSGYRLKVDGIEDNNGLKSALQKERESNKEAKQRLAELERLREEAEKKTLEEQGKYKDLSERERKEKVEAQQRLNELTRKVAEREGLVLIKGISSELTTDPIEREIIERFAKDFLEYDGDTAKFNKDIKEVKDYLTKFVKNKASGTDDKGNNRSGGSGAIMSRQKFAGLNPAEQAKFFADGGTLTDK